MKFHVLIGLVGYLLMAAPSHGLVLKIATLSPEGSVWMEKMRAGADELSRKTGNRVKFKFFPGGVMGNDKAVMRKIRVGQLHGGAVSAGSLSHLYVDSGLYSLPLKFNNFKEVDHIREKMDSIIVDGLEKSGFVTFGLAEGGFAYMMSNKPVRTTADLKNKKVWIPTDSPSTAQVLNTLGINPIPLPIADVRTSLQTGLVDTVPAPPIVAIVLQWHTQIKYVTQIPLSYVYGMLAIAKRSFLKLSEDDRQVVKDVMGRVFREIDRQNRKDNLEALKALREIGIEFVKPAAQVEAEWRAAGARVVRGMLEADRISQQAVDRLDALLDAYRSRG